jgi:hypothetical protein
VVFEYRPTQKQHAASLSFHITAREKNDVMRSMALPVNQHSLQQIQKIIR